MVIGPEVVEGKARPLYIYSDKASETGVERLIARSDSRRRPRDAAFTAPRALKGAVSRATSCASSAGSLIVNRPHSAEPARRLQGLRQCLEAPDSVTPRAIRFRAQVVRRMAAGVLASAPERT